MKSLTFLLFVVVLSASPLFASEGKEMIFIRQGAVHMEAKDYLRAVKAFAQAARHNPNNAEAQKGLGMAYLKLGATDAATNVEMIDNAVAAFNEVLRLAPNSADVRYQLALAYLMLNDKNGALREYEALKGVNAELADRLHPRIKEHIPPKSFKTLVSSGPTQPKSTRVTVAGNHVLVPVSLSHAGKIVQATLMLDTGASSTLISRELASRLNIDARSGTPARFQVVGGGTVDGWRAKLDQMVVGPHAKSGIDVAVVVESGAFPFDGLLGMNFLRSYKYSIDFANQVINWTH